MTKFELFSVVPSIVGVIIGIFGKTLFINAFRFLSKPFMSYNMMKSGVENLHSTRTGLKRRNDDDIFNLVKESKSEIGIVALSLNDYIRDKGIHVKLVNLLGERPELKINVFLLNPNSNIIEKMEKAIGWKKKALVDRIHESIDKFKFAINDKGVSDESRGRLNVYLYDEVIPSWYIVCDPNESNGAIFIENQPYGLNINDRYTIEVKGKGRLMYDNSLRAYKEFKKNNENDDNVFSLS